VTVGVPGEMTEAQMNSFKDGSGDEQVRFEEAVGET
jgi:hypothetical protein